MPWQPLKMKADRLLGLITALGLTGAQLLNTVSGCLNHIRIFIFFSHLFQKMKVLAFVDKFYSYLGIGMYLFGDK